MIVPDCVVRISRNKNITDYQNAVIRRAQPDVYPKYNCIKLRFTKDMEIPVKCLCRYLWNIGIVPKKKVKMKGGIPVDKGILIGDAREIILVKIPAIQDTTNKEFEDWWNETKYEEED
jgi:hypothetical protein